MWFFDLLRKRAAARRYEAALAVLLSINAYAKLSPAKRLRVDAEFVSLLARAGVSPVESRRFGPWYARALDRGWAMALLGMETGIEDMKWPKEFDRSPFRIGPAAMSFAFRASSAETERAASYLRARGAYVPEPLPAEASYEEALAAFLRHEPMPSETWSTSAGV